MTEGLIDIRVRETGCTPRHLRKAMTGGKREAWHKTGVLFHAEMRDERFTAEHGRKAGYQPRQGEQAGQGGKFWRTYTGQKLRKWRHKRPLEWSGETRRLVRSANITATTKLARVSYSGARKLNYRRWPSSPRMADEFRKLLPEEITKLAARYDESLDRYLATYQETTTTKV